MRKIISILMAFALVLNLFGKSFGNNQKLQKNVDETNIYESYLNKKTQKMNIKVTDALSKKLVYADSVDLSNIDEEKILKCIQENQEIEKVEQENLKILETEDDELKDVDHYILEAHKREIKENKTYRSILIGYSYKLENKFGKNYWTFGQANKLFESWSYFTVIEDDENKSEILRYTEIIKSIKEIERNMIVASSASAFCLIAQFMPKIGFWGVLNTRALSIAIIAAAIGIFADRVIFQLGEILKHEPALYIHYGSLLKYSKLQSEKPPQEVNPPEEIKPPYPTTPGIAYGGKGF